MSDWYDLPLTMLSGVGDKLAERFARIGIHAIRDLLFHLPIRYEDRTRLVPIRSLLPECNALIDGEIANVEVRNGRRRTLTVTLSDNTGWLTIRFFHFKQAQAQRLRVGMRLRCFGEVRTGPSGLTMIHPEYTAYQPPNAPPLASHLTPVYPVTSGITQHRIRGLIEQVLARLRVTPIDDVLQTWWQKPSMPTLSEALSLIHQPPVGTDVTTLVEGTHPACQRLILEELIAHQVGLRLARTQIRQQPTFVTRCGNWQRQLASQLPFNLTHAQKRVIREINENFAVGKPMMRLVQGDVGSGKTLVAAMAALPILEAGWQVALMAPTEILAEQHLTNFTQWLRPFNVKVLWLAGSQTRSDKKKTLEAMQSPEPLMVIGTHALFQENVEFANLALVIVDEQHRFGVHQRLALTHKGKTPCGRMPHQLIMTATPIPRTLAMTAYADLDVSIIDELPPGRKPITTVVVSEARREEVIQRVRNQCHNGRQAYWVCTLIDESETLQAQAAESTAKALSERLPDVRIGLVHGRMKNEQKEAVMSAFKQGDIDLLVATTVIEVGVDVPNASLMIIENPERLGLAQLHQLRGRVGRGEHQSYCVLMYKPPLSPHAKQRLQTMRETQDGFLIAEADLKLRGPGEILGTRQTGTLRFKIADIGRDQYLLPTATKIANRIAEEAPALVEPLTERWLAGAIHYAEA